MKNVFFNALGFLSILLCSYVGTAQNTYPNYQIGLQATFPAVGLSGKANITETHSAQAVVGIFGPFGSYYGRYLYHFDFKQSDWGIEYRPYLFGTLGYFTYDGLEALTGSKESSLGYGVGAGIEWCPKNFLKELKFNVEIGYTKVDFVGYDFKTIMFGGGMHYQFDF